MEPFYTTRPVKSGGGMNANYIVLDTRWGCRKGDLVAFTVHVHDRPEFRYNVTKTIGTRGNSLVVYIPKAWKIPVGTLCVVEVTPVTRTYSVQDVDEEDEIFLDDEDDEDGQDT